VSAQATEAPAVGSFVVDTRTERVARVMAVRYGRLYLRPPTGGTEWEAMPAHVRPTSPQEDLSTRVSIENARSRYGAPSGPR
jgi:hypothetical protein